MAEPVFTLEDIRAHPAFPFPRWLDDDFQYLMLELYWAGRVRALLGDDLAGFQPLFDTDRDGNPILTLTHPDKRRGLRLVMLDNEDAKPLYPDAMGADAFYGLYGFMNNSRMPDGETPIEELVLLVALDERYAEHFDHFVTCFCRDAETPAQMEAQLQKYETDFGQSSPDPDATDS